MQEAVRPEYLQLAVDKMLAGESSFCFFQCPQRQKLLSYAHAIAEPTHAELKFLTFAKANRHSPYYLLLNLFRELIEEQQADLSTLVSQATDYLPLQALMLAWLSGDQITRSEFVVMDDLHYERQSFFQALVRLLDVLVVKPTVLVIDAIQLASVSALYCLQFLADNCQTSPLLVLLAMDSQQALMLRQDDEKWEDFLNWLDDGYVLRSLPILSPGLPVNLPSVSMIDAAPLDLALVQSNLHLMAWPEAAAATLALLENESDDALQCQLRICLAEAYLYLGEPDRALNQLDKLQTSVFLQSSRKTQIHVLCLMSLTLVYSQDFDDALQRIHAAISLAKEEEDVQLRAQAMFVHFFVHDKSSLVSTLPDFERLVVLLEQYQMPCSRLYCLRNFYTFLRFHEDLSADRAMTVTQQAIHLAKQLQHRQGIGATYHSKGILYSYLGDYHKTFRCFGVSYRIRQGLGEPQDLVRIQNGIGYLNTLLENYHDAAFEYAEAFKLARHQDDYAELLASLYNFAWLYYCTRHYQLACDILDTLSKLCRMLSFSHFPFRNLFDVFSLKGLCHAKLGELSRAQQCIDRMDRLSFQPSKTGSFMQAMLLGVLFTESGKLTQAITRFKKAPNLLGSVVDMDSRLIPMCYMEQLRSYTYLGDWKSAAELLECGRSLCRKMQLPVCVTSFDIAQQKIDAQLKIENQDFPQYPLVELDLDLASLVSDVSKSERLAQAHQRLRELKLVSRLQGFPQRFPNAKDLTEETLKLVSNSLSAQAAMAFRFQKNRWQLWAKSSSTLFSPDLLPLLDRVGTSKQLQVMTEICRKGEPGQRASYNASICLPLFCDDEIYAVFCLCYTNSDRYFDKQNQETLSVLTHQLGNQLQQLEHEQRLLYLSTTDPLTKLYNRQAMNSALDNTLHQPQRGTQYCSVAYLDLDNFKHINDFHGHEVGDRLLQTFAEFLNNSLRDEDMAARWGGDEFVIIFPNTDLSQAQTIGQRLLQSLSDCDYFKAELQAWSKAQAMIPEALQWGCSIGLACCESGHEKCDGNQLLQAADRALYQAKGKGKGRLVSADFIEIDAG